MGELNETGVSGDSDCGLREPGVAVGSTPGMDTWSRRWEGITTWCERREREESSRAWDSPRLIIVLDLGRKLERGEK
jgi:hypothetical protein